MEDAALVRRLRQGSRLALEQAIGRYTPYVSAVVCNALSGRGRREDVEEIVSDVFLALWSHAGGLDSERGLRPWLAVTARNRAIDWLRTHPAPPDLPQEAAPGTAEGPEAEV